MPRAIEWEKIKAEYISTKISKSELASKHKISYQTLRNHSKTWAKERKEFRKKVEKKALSKAEQKAVQKSLTIDDVAMKTLKLLADIVAQQQIQLDKQEEAIDVRDVKAITGALRDIKDITGAKYGMDKKEQDLRIKALEKQLNEENNDNKIEITFAESVDESWLQ